ncbi:HotDog domain-containing protein [Talaromyces proteolyticus]|uniref:HotDog domain-containing protein n=1 Tax=Talaromyces proteolyticus TaxID=1131652 RepID=A0AAD4KGX4_9EURO|nr:HotDog domain-containing protein [Talaromyces proteolyticus]KAH8691465.1 HotDog domain-containing protein [Talaromyces proteolyticus]
MADKDVSHFQSIPWVSALLRDPSFVNITFTSRHPKSTTEDSFYARTLNTPSTISACLLQYRIPESSPVSSPTSSTPPTSTTHVQETRAFFTLGSDLNGYPGTLHGGMISTMLDECTGLLLTVRGELDDASMRNEDNLYSAPVTAYLNTTFKQPVPTPGTVVVRTKLLEVKDSRKWKIRADICDEKGTVLATGDCLFVRLKAKM